MQSSWVVYIATKGSVMALDRNTGESLWKTSLRGVDFVTLMLDGDRLLAATGGEVFCLDSATGETLWRNNLPGMGYGLVSLASGSTPHSVPSAQQARKLEEEQAAMLAATDVTTQY